MKTMGHSETKNKKLKFAKIRWKIIIVVRFCWRWPFLPRVRLLHVSFAAVKMQTLSRNAFRSFDCICCFVFVSHFFFTSFSFASVSAGRPIWPNAMRQTIWWKMIFFFSFVFWLFLFYSFISSKIVNVLSVSTNIFIISQD